MDCKQSLFSLKICGEERKTRDLVSMSLLVPALVAACSIITHRSHIMLAVTLAHSLALHSCPQRKIETAHSLSSV